MSKKYYPKPKEFIIPASLLLVCLGILMFSFSIESIILKAIILLFAVIAIIWSVGSIMRIFLKIFLQEIKGW